MRMETSDGESVEVRRFCSAAEAGPSQLRVLYRSSSSGLDWPKSMRAGSGWKPEPSAGGRETERHMGNDGKSQSQAHRKTPRSEISEHSEKS